MNTAHHADAAGLNTPAINYLTEEVAALDRAGAMLQTAATLNTVTRRSLEVRPADPQIDAPRAGRNGEGRGRDQGKANTPDCADDLAGDQPGARPHQRPDPLSRGRPAQDPRRDTVMTGRVSNALGGAGVSAPGFATLAALAARNGITLIALADGGYLLCKWGLSRALPDLCVVASLLRHMGMSV